MKKISFILFSLILAVIIGSCTATKESAEGEKRREDAKPLSSSFKMLSINVMHGLQDKADVKLFADWVKSTGAEVLAVQQIMRATDSKPGFDAFDELLKRLDMRGTFAKARYYQGWDSGNALFCLYPLLQSHTYVIPAGKGKVRRSLSFGVFELGLKSVAFASTDLDDENITERAKQVYEILAIQKSMEELPMIIAGNFGEAISGKSSAKMLQKYTAVNSLSDQLANAVQHIYVPSDKKMKIISAEKTEYKPLKQAGILTTIEVQQ